MGYPHFAPTLLWNLPLPSELGVKKPANIFAFSLDDKFLFTLHEDQGGILWDLTTTSLPRKLEFGQDNPSSKHPIRAAALDGNNGLIIAFGLTHPAEYYNIPKDGTLLKLANYVLPVANDVKVSRDGSVFAFTTGATVELWDAHSFQEVKVLIPNVETRNQFEKVALSQDNKYVATIDSEGQFFVWGLDNDFHKVSQNSEVGIDLGQGWIPSSIGLSEHNFVMAALRKRTTLGQDSWMLMSWGYKYEGPDNTLYAKEYPNCALTCVAPSTVFSVSLTPEGHLRGSDSMLWPLFSTEQGASKKGKAVSCGISESSKVFAAARTNGRVAVWRLYTQDADPNERYPG
ncbi:putative wd-40 repeat-containing serine threonine protein kinase protein [Daldinia childiae]|uniref:putative wd-40 repeat-containing serine threonine protein kinase protein n=1 Tax=Daldinia childiae TaxID=326645 RepID=UPI001446FB37|nr:putative wd-40 repeat-containing serine threonine protein kinase protein [Daldinia childiae]KAF3067114.1 putative wd-40 repeat-containing serine threonine protein kinase protein [Daldinia childiae]